jgi:hypothetical protein
MAKKPSSLRDFKFGKQYASKAEFQKVSELVSLSFGRGMKITLLARRLGDVVMCIGSDCTVSWKDSLQKKRVGS